MPVVPRPPRRPRVDPMASSGMIIKVWQERHQWLDNPEQQISITTADLVPRWPYEGQMQQCDLTQDLPIPKPDYAIIDPPYLGMSQGQYSSLPNDLGNMDPGK